MVGSCLAGPGMGRGWTRVFLFDLDYLRVGQELSRMFGFSLGRVEVGREHPKESKMVR